MSKKVYWVEVDFGDREFGEVYVRAESREAAESLVNTLDARRLAEFCGVEVAPETLVTDVEEVEDADDVDEALTEEEIEELRGVVRESEVGEVIVETSCPCCQAVLSVEYDGESPPRIVVYGERAEAR